MHPNNEIRLGFSELLCIGLGETLRNFLAVAEPRDVRDRQWKELYFKYEVERGKDFFVGFTDDVNLHGKTVLEIGCKYGGMQASLLEAGVNRSYGLDLDHGALVYGQAKLASSERIDLVLGNAENIPLQAESIDMVVSDATFEHIHAIDLTLHEIARVLRPGGWLFAKFSPTWLTYNGPHLIKCIPIPWAHLVFSEQTLLNVLHYYEQRDVFPASYIREKIIDFQRMGRLTRKKFRQSAQTSGLTTIQEYSYSRNPLKNGLSRLPLFDELLAGQIFVVLKKSDSQT